MDGYDFSYYMPLIMGVSFVVVGTVVGLSGRLNKQKRTQDQVRYYMGVGFVVLGIAITVSILSGPTPSTVRQEDRECLHVKADEVRSMRLEPGYRHVQIDVNSNLISMPIEIEDRAEIIEICEALKSARIFSPNHPHPVWECKLIINAKDRELKIRMSRTSNQGLILWMGRSYRCDNLGDILEKIAHWRNRGQSPIAPLTPESPRAGRKVDPSEKKSENGSE